MNSHSIAYLIGSVGTGLPASGTFTLQNIGGTTATFGAFYVAVVAHVTFDHFPGQAPATWDGPGHNAGHAVDLAPGTSAQFLMRPFFPTLLFPESSTGALRCQWKWRCGWKKQSAAPRDFGFGSN